MIDVGGIGQRWAADGSKRDARVLAAQAAGQPVISVDTKKKELVGNYRNGGSDYRPKGEPQRVKTHDFDDKTIGKAVPYGVYDIGADEGWVSVGVTADCGGKNGARVRLWKLELQKFAVLAQT